MEFEKEQDIINKLTSLKQIVPDQKFIDRVKTSLVYSLPVENTKKSPLLGFRAALASFLVLILISGGAVFASQNSLPGQALYPVKRSWEAVKLQFANQQDRVRLQLQLTDERLKELQKTSGEDLEKAASEYEKAVEGTVDDISKAGSQEALKNLEEKLNQHSQSLEAASQKASETAKEALERAKEVSQKGASKAKEALGKKPQTDYPDSENLPNIDNPSGRR